MKQYELWCGEKRILSRCTFSPSLWFRLKGLLGRSSLAEDEGIWIKPCNSIHMFFMRFAIDAVFLDKNDRVLCIYHGIRPWRISAILREAKSVVEMRTGTCKRLLLAEKDLIQFKELRAGI